MGIQSLNIPSGECYVASQKSVFPSGCQTKAALLPQDPLDSSLSLTYALLPLSLALFTCTTFDSTIMAPSTTPLRAHTILAATIHITSLQFIAALLLTLMLLWHISTVSLVENYQMPAWWVRAFLAKHASGWRMGVWTVVGVLVSETNQLDERLQIQ